MLCCDMYGLGYNGWLKGSLDGLGIYVVLGIGGRHNEKCRVSK